MDFLIYKPLIEKILFLNNFEKHGRYYMRIDSAPRGMIVEDIFSI